MAGVKGKSGGARPGAGGKRPGAGRPKKQVEPAQPGGAVDAIKKTDDPRVFLTALMNDSRADLKLRADAAKALLASARVAVADAGKKGAAKDAATKASTGRFGPSAPPRLVSSSR